MSSYDALLLVSFGGPEAPEEVMPFLRRVTRGRNVPDERLEVVAQHYHHFDGKSPINEQCRELIGKLNEELDAHQIKLPIYFGNRNSAPFLKETLEKMREDGKKNALALIVSAYSSYSGCRQYRENIEAAVAEVENAPAVTPLRRFFNHPGFVEANIARVKAALKELHDQGQSSEETHLVFTAHSIPQSMAQGCSYEDQLREVGSIVAERVGSCHWDLVWQSRSGPPHIPWLEPDVLDHLRSLKKQGVPSVVVAPIGFITDHLEVQYDLDVEARQCCEEIGLTMVRAKTAGTHPLFITGLRQLIEERLSDAPRLRLGKLPATPDVCPIDCCLPPQRGRPPAVR